ncbi:MAG: TonB-dependent receptor, partial [Candidatus Uhrbacteria bacterium]|nr:TonB-dependent receptor [Candidatus Uhrbacteria bacterium]
MKRIFTMLTFWAFLNSGWIFSQEISGTVRGIVTDQSGGAIPEAKILVVKVSVAGPTEVTEATTDSSGGYVLSLSLGDYHLVFVKPGFNDLTTQTAVRAGGNVVLNASMELAGITQTITVNVEGEVAPIDTGSSQIQTTIPSDEQSKLPSGTGFTGSVERADGVRREPVGGGLMSDGSSRAENKFFINGVDVSDAETGSLRLMSNIPFEFIQETQVKRSSNAEFGGAMGAVVNGVLKRGENAIHGQVWSYYSNDKMNASPNQVLHFSEFDDEVVSYLRHQKDNQWALAPGYYLGGPVIQNKLFFFSGSRPSFARTEREVRFLKNNLPGSFSSSTRQDFTVNRLDYETAYRQKKLQVFFAHMYSPLRVRGVLPDQEGTGSPATL